MNFVCFRYIFLAVTVSLAGCSSSVEIGSGGAGGAAGTGGTAGSGGSAGAGGSAGMGGSAGTGGAAGAGGAAGTGGTGGTRPCTSSETVEFTFSGAGADADCIVPGVCLARNRAKGIYNTETELGPQEESPEGTQWALSNCGDAPPPDDFTDFVQLLRSIGGGGQMVDDNLVDADLCLWLPNEGLFYDVVFSSWGIQNQSNFAYSRTAIVPDECGVADATCGATCGCPAGFVEGSDGLCVVPNPCDPSPCDPSASCRRTGARAHRCECDAVEFTRPPGQSEVCDQVNDGVCLARPNPTGVGPGGGLYNSFEEPTTANRGVCSSPVASRPSIPTFTEWSLEPCASAVDGDFVNFFDDGYACGGNLPTTIVGPESCLRTTNPANDGELWSIQFTDWCVTNDPITGIGCFSLARWREVADGEACTP